MIQIGRSITAALLCAAAAGPFVEVASAANDSGGRERLYSRKELYDFDLAGVRLGMTESEVRDALTSRGYELRSLSNRCAEAYFFIGAISRDVRSGLRHPSEAGQAHAQYDGMYYATSISCGKTDAGGWTSTVNVNFMENIPAARCTPVVVKVRFEQSYAQRGTEAFPRAQYASNLKKALLEKYGPPTRDLSNSEFNDLEWRAVDADPKIRRGAAKLRVQGGTMTLSDSDQAHELGMQREAFIKSLHTTPALPQKFGF